MATSINPIVEELTSPDPVVNWILPGFIPRSALLTIAGTAGAGKSYLTYTIGMALAAGIPVIGMDPIRPFRILYFDQENSRPDRIQYQRWAWSGLGKPSLDLMAQNFWPEPFVLGSANWYTIAAELVSEHKPDLFVIDTTTPACNIQDENDNAEASRVIGDIRRLQSLTQPTATALVLKHGKVRSEKGQPGDPTTLTLRGAKAWEGAVDGIVYVVRSPGQPRKDGLAKVTLTPGKTRAFGLREHLTIFPSWLPDNAGIVLNATPKSIIRPKTDE